MQKLVTTIAALYARQEPTGEVILDAVVPVLRRTNTQSVADVAAALDVEARHLSGAVQLLTGLPLKELILTWRALQARELLRDETLTLDEVAHRCGFVQKKNLIDFFARRYGMTPMVYRTGRVSRHSEYRVNK